MCSPLLLLHVASHCTIYYDSQLSHQVTMIYSQHFDHFLGINFKEIKLAGNKNYAYRVILVESLPCFM